MKTAKEWMHEFGSTQEPDLIISNKKMLDGERWSGVYAKDIEAIQQNAIQSVSTTLPDEVIDHIAEIRSLNCFRDTELKTKERHIVKAQFQQAIKEALSLVRKDDIEAIKRKDEIISEVINDLAGWPNAMEARIKLATAFDFKPAKGAE